MFEICYSNKIEGPVLPKTTFIGTASWRFFDGENYTGSYMDLTGPGCFNHADVVFALQNDKVVSSRILGK